jgi:glycosyltransferase involved in cell wall biosynthesis
VPYIATVWDLEHRAQPYLPELSANGEWEAREEYFQNILQRASYVITGTQTGKREIEQFYGVAPERIHLLKHPTPDFAIHAKNNNGVAPKQTLNNPFLLYPAQFWAHKNHITLLKVVAWLKQEGKMLDLALVGSDKGNREYIESEAEKLGIKEQVKFLGFVSRDELVYLYKNALALSYSSLCGPENLPPLEAFAFGCPVIASDIPGSREQLGEAAMLVPAMDKKAWTNAILQLLDRQQSRNVLIQAGHLRAQAYTSQHFLSDIDKIFVEFKNIRSLWH